ncbi:hypothetical protein GE09DRAFT_1283423 [Coniochaeta sp. 2T2.1]|nr:hypothetical protein GE09DRAFT_1283423 [Coniochaeta sp. 2T2.1]
MASATGSSTPANGADPSAPIRIKRNTACVRCRDAKVKCNASLNSGRQCLRCSKLDLDCVVDKGHKRTSRRSKLEELAAEVRNIKEAVASGPPSSVSPVVATQQPPIHLQSPSARGPSYLGTGGGILPTYPTPPTGNLPFGGGLMSADAAQSESPALASFTAQRASGQVAQPRALASSVFSGEEIDYYFDRYFEQFHSFMPIVRVRDPDACYQAAPVLFWAIIVTACRRYARRESTFQFLVNSITSEIGTAMTAAPIRPPVITALLILSTWSLPTIRFMADPTYMYTGVALNSCSYLGLHTGKGCLSELCGPRYNVRATDEEALYLWAAANIISLRTSSFLGYLPTAPFIGKALHGVIDGTSPYSIPRSFSVNLATAKWTNGFLKAISVAIEEGRGISYHVVEQMEEDFVKLQRSLHDGTPDIDEFMLRSTLLEVQVLYWMPLPGCGDETLRRNLARTFSTSEDLVRLALDLHRQSDFLTHAPHYVFRSLLLAGCIIISYLRSPYPLAGFAPAGGGDNLVQDMVSALKACSVQADDLPIRASAVAEAYWSVRNRLPPWDVSRPRPADFKHRLGSALVYDCLGTWKKDLDLARNSGGDSAPAVAAGESYGGDTGLAAGQNADLSLSDPLFRGIDWSSFMDDFEWNFPPPS